MIRYLDTRGAIDAPRTFTEAILEGIAPGGGLFVPERLPRFTVEQIVALADVPYHARAAAVYEAFGLDVTAEKTREFAARAYGPNFDVPEVAPVREVAPGRHVLELWHGPTLAFKDMALQCLPLYFSEALEQAHAKGATGLDFLILVATSGDTGVAALNGFADRAHTRICVYYPDAGVSALQELQMVTQPGDNLIVFRLGGDFDDCQSSVKAVFDDGEFAAELAERHQLSLSSANSINWGRLLPQIVYYLQRLRRPRGARRGHGRRADRRLRPHRQLRQHPRRLVRARHRRAHRPPAVRQQPQQRALRLPLERGLRDRRPLAGQDALAVHGHPHLVQSGAAPVRPRRRPGAHRRLDEGAQGDRPVRGGRGHTQRCARPSWARRWPTTPASRSSAGCSASGYLLDPHTAVAWEAAERLAGEAPVLIASTAHWSKFAADVVRGLTGVPAGVPVPGAEDDLGLLEKVVDLAPGATVPPQLRAVRERPRRFDARIEAGREPVETSLREWLGEA